MTTIHTLGVHIDEAPQVPGDDLHRGLEPPSYVRGPSIHFEVPLGPSHMHEPTFTRLTTGAFQRSRP